MLNPYDAIISRSDDPKCQYNMKFLFIMQNQDVIHVFEYICYANKQVCFIRSLIAL